MKTREELYKFFDDAGIRIGVKPHPLEGFVATIRYDNTLVGVGKYPSREQAEAAAFSKANEIWTTYKKRTSFFGES